MLDRQRMDRELSEARSARREAEAAQAEVEAMLHELRALPPMRPEAGERVPPG